MTKPLTEGALAATACLPEVVPLGGAPLDRVAQILSDCADYLDEQADDLDPQGKAGNGCPWDFMQVARQLRDFQRRIARGHPQ